MRARNALALVLVMLLPAFAGCYEEELQVALRVRAGESLTLTGEQRFDGTVLVEQGGTLAFVDADVIIAQALVVENGILRVERSRLAFSGPFTRHDAELRGTITLQDATLVGVRNFEALGGAILVSGGSVAASAFRLEGADVLSQDAAWSLGPASATGNDGAGRFALEVQGGTLVVENGSLEIPGGPGILVGGGETRISNLSLDLSRPEENAFTVNGGAVELRSVDVVVDDLQRWLDVHGTVRLVDSPLPRNAPHPFVGAGGRLEVGWTVLARVVGTPGDAPIPNATVTLRSAHEPAADSAQAVTDENGEATLVALQHVIGGAGTRTGNPHVLRADANGRTGAMPALVVEAPAVVIVRVAGAGATGAAGADGAPRDAVPALV